MPCRAAVAVPPVAARSAWARARPHASLPRVAFRLVRTRAAESDGGSPDDDDASASSSESLFTPEFSAAFRAAQERLDAKEAASPERARINDEVANSKLLVVDNLITQTASLRVKKIDEIRDLADRFVDELNRMREEDKVCAGQPPVRMRRG